MPPRLSAVAAALRPAQTTNSNVSAFLLPFLQARSASILSNLSDRDEAYSKRIRRGRGPSSGKGKTSGRGHKGQKQHGKVPAKFQGGQTPPDIVKGERGFKNLFTPEMSPINLDRIQQWIDQGRLDPSKPITVKELASSRCLHGVKDGVKLLARGKGELKTPINILVSRASAAAIESIEAAGGQVTTRYYTKQSIHRLLKGDSESSFTPFGAKPSAAAESAAAESPILAQAKPFAFRLPDPTSRKDIEYYRDSAHRGYLSHLVPEGEGPSLYFRAPGMVKPKQRKGAEKEERLAKTSKLW